MLGTSEFRRVGGVRGNRPTVATVGSVGGRSVWGWVPPDRTGNRHAGTRSQVLFTRFPRRRLGWVQYPQQSKVCPVRVPIIHLSLFARTVDFVGLWRS